MKPTSTSTPCFLTNSRTIVFTPRTYKEEIWERGTEPQSRSLNFVLHFSHLQWHVKVTFRGTLQSAQTAAFAKVTKRRNDLENLCLCIDFDFIQLLDDTVTELIVTRQHDGITAHSQRLRFTTALNAESEYAPVDYLWLYIQEDPFRVRFPVYNGGGDGTSTKDLSEIRKTQELSTGVHVIRVNGVENPYVYKEINRPLYVPRDSEVLEKELRNLERLRGTEGVVQLVAVVISDNPYQTAKTKNDDSRAVLQGILLEYHPNGTLQNALQDALQSPKPKDLPWHRWAFQVAGTLTRLHQIGITHMDLKPENIVLSEDLNAILIDLSGIGGTTRKWLSPDMKVLSNPLSQDIKLRMQNDFWALGKILSAMVDATCNEMEKQLLRRVSFQATTETLPCISLHDAISNLSQLRL